MIYNMYNVYVYVYVCVYIYIYIYIVLRTVPLGIVCLDVDWFVPFLVHQDLHTYRERERETKREERESARTHARASERTRERESLGFRSLSFD